MAAILGLEFAGGPVRSTHGDAIPLKLVIEPIAIGDPIAHEMLGLGLQDIEVKTALPRRDRMMIRGGRTHRQWQPMATHDRANLHTFFFTGVWWRAPDTGFILSHNSRSAASDAG
jgi:hypothetical protein